MRSSLTLHQMNSSTSGWSALRMTIFAARRVLPPDLIVPADASAPRMKLTGPDAVPPPSSSSTLERIFDRLMPEPEPPLKITPSSRYQFENRVHRVVDGEDETRTRLLRHAFDADVEPHRTVEGGPLGDEDVLQFGVERLGLGVVDEVPALDPPPGDRVDDAVDDLTQRRLALGRTEACPGSTSGRRCWWHSPTTRPGTRHRAARTRRCRLSSW